MARRRRRTTRRRRRGTGSVIRVRRANSLGQLRNPNSVAGAAIPVLAGGGVATITTIGLTSWMQPTAQNAPFMRNAPWIGLGAGVLTSMGLGAMTRKTATTTMGVASSIVAALAFLMPGWISAMGNGGVAANGATAGVGAVVPEYSRGVGRSGTGAIVMEPHASRGYGAGALGAGRRRGMGSYGEVVNLGAINSSVFGSAPFKLSGAR